MKPSMADTVRRFRALRARPRRAPIWSFARGRAHAETEYIPLKRDGSPGYDVLRVAESETFTLDELGVALPEITVKRSEFFMSGMSEKAWRALFLNTPDV